MTVCKEFGSKFGIAVELKCCNMWKFGLEAATVNCICSKLWESSTIGQFGGIPLTAWKKKVTWQKMKYSNEKEGSMLLDGMGWLVTWI